LPLQRATGGVGPGPSFTIAMPPGTGAGFTGKGPATVCSNAPSEATVRN
jgi:hypothetical protein